MPYTIYMSERSTLTPRHRELLILRTAWLTGKQPIWASRVPIAKTEGLTAAEIRRVAEGPPAGWSSFEATLLRLADELYRNSSVTDATWNTLAVDYDILRLMDAVETVNNFVVLSLFYNSLGIQPDAGTTDRLPADVPYRVAVPEREPPLKTAQVTPLEGDSLAVARTFRRHTTLNEP